MAVNGAGVRDTARVLKVSLGTVIEELKKKEDRLQSVNQPLLQRLDVPSLHVEMHKVTEEAEADEMGGVVQSKKQQRWLWHAIASP